MALGENKIVGITECQNLAVDGEECQFLVTLQDGTVRAARLDDGEITIVDGLIEYKSNYNSRW